MEAYKAPGGNDDVEHCRDPGATSREALLPTAPSPVNQIHVRRRASRATHARAWPSLSAPTRQVPPCEALDQQRSLQAPADGQCAQRLHELGVNKPAALRRSLFIHDSVDAGSFSGRKKRKGVW